MVLCVPGAATAGPTPDEALREVNRWRAEAGIPPIDRFDAELSDGCRLHNAYMQRNGVVGHGEDERLPGYTPEGARAGESSVLSGSEAGPKRAWEDAVFHRTSILDPRLRVSGFDASSGHSCMWVFGENGPPAAAPTLYPWPRDGQEDVPIAGIAPDIEGPDPYDVVPGATAMGFLISANVDGPWPEQASGYVTFAELTDEKGEHVAASIVAANTHDLSGYLDGGFGVFPHELLRAGTRYTVRIEGVAAWMQDAVIARTGRSQRVMRELPVARRWSFRTAGEPSRASAPGRRATRLRLLVGRQGKVVAKSRSRARIRLSASRGGRVRWRRTVKPGKAIRIRLPPGRYRLCARQAATSAYFASRACRTLRLGIARASAAKASGMRELHPPRMLAAPSISGSPEPGSTLTCDAGEWSPAAARTVVDWTVDDVRVGRSATYTPLDADAGGVVRCLVMAYPAGESQLFGRAWSAPVTVLGQFPVNNAPPELYDVLLPDAPALVGRQMTCARDRWDVAGTRDWRILVAGAVRDAGTGRPPTSGPEARTFTAQPGDAGHEAWCDVSMTNARGTTGPVASQHRLVQDWRRAQTPCGACPASPDAPALKQRSSSSGLLWQFSQAWFPDPQTAAVHVVVDGHVAASGDLTIRATGCAETAETAGCKADGTDATTLPVSAGAVHVSADLTVMGTTGPLDRVVIAVSGPAGATRFDTTLVAP